MKRQKRTHFFVAILLTLTMLFTVGCGSASTATKQAPSSDKTKEIQIKGGFQGSIDAWPAYNAVNNGIQEKYGINLNMEFFDSGMPMAQTIPTHELAILCNGSVPCLMSAMRYDAPIIGISTNESSCNAIVSRPENAVFKNKNENGSFGTAEQVKGKTFLCTTISSGHYVLSKYLESLGLTEKDVVIKNIEQAQGIKSFETGDGDFLVLWAPFLYRAYEKGWEKVADGSQIDAATYLLWQADPNYIKENPEALAKVLLMCNEGVKKYQSDGEKLIPDIIHFFSDFSAMDISENDAKLDITTHKVYTLEEQLAQFENGTLSKDLENATKFFIDQKTFSEEEGKKLIEKNMCLDSSIIKKALELEKK